MPIPKPNPGELEVAFITRCMNNETMREDYPQTSQRLAICYSTLREVRTESPKVDRGMDKRRKG